MTSAQYSAFVSEFLSESPSDAVRANVVEQKEGRPGLLIFPSPLLPTIHLHSWLELHSSHGEVSIFCKPVKYI